MKKYLLFIIFILFCTQKGFSQNSIVRHYPNGNIKYQGFLKGDTLDGAYISFYKDGTAKERGSFKDCIYKTDSIEIIEYSICGKDKFDNDIYLGKKDGEWYSYYESGNLKTIENYNCNIKEGSWISFFESGVTEQTQTFSAGKLLYAEKYNEDATRIESLKRHHSFDKRKQTESKMDFITIYYENGVERENYYLNDNDIKVGKYEEYWINGVLREEGTYKDDKKNGVIKQYNEIGNLIKEYHETYTK